MRRRVLALLAFALLAAAPAAASAGDAAAAATLFREGRAAAKRGDYESACSKLEESYRLDAAVGTLLNVADCEEHLGKIASAWQRYQQAGEQLPPSDPRGTIAKQRARTLEQRLPHLTVILDKAAPSGTKVRRGEVELGAGSLGTALPVDPGRHTVKVTAPGREDRSFVITVREQATVAIEVAPGKALPRTGMPDATAPGASPATRGGMSMSPLRITGLVVGGVGVASLAAGLATGIILQGKVTAIKAYCPGPQCSTLGKAVSDSAKPLLPFNAAALIGGGAFAAAGLALVIVGKSETVSSPVPPTVSLELTLGGVGASIQGRF
jgi:hypothetical protein